MNYILQDNFLNQQDFNVIYSTLLGENFPWFFAPYKVYKEKQDRDIRDFQFTHMVYFNHSVRTHMPEIFEPLLEKISPAAIVKIKANLTPITDKQIIYDMHIDVNNFNFKGKTAVFYLNTNNGYTLFEDGTNIDSVANRILIFDANIPHTGTSCTDEQFRCVLNINYFPR